ncbi:MAG TPA: hypothetical protein VI895_05985 [Bdellovibrionota bacterium]|nr:hypothetical protein [Bdellovibrionota bacterium]
MPFVFEILWLSVLATFISAVSLLLGRFLQPFIFPWGSENKYEQTFLVILSGLIGLTTVWAMWVTKGVTIHTAFFVSAASVWLLSPNAKPTFQRPHWQDGGRFLLWMMVTMLLVSLVRLFHVYPETIENDVLIYAKRIHDLSVYGVENWFHFFNEIVPEFVGTSPYHYFEFWLGNILYQGLRMPESVVLIHGVYAWLQALGLLGIVILVRPKTIGQWAAAGSVAFFLSLTQTWHALNIGSDFWPIYADVWIRPNFLTYVLFLVPVFGRLGVNDVRSALLCLLYLPVVSITTAPAVFTGIFLYAAYRVVRGKDRDHFMIKILAATILNAAYIALFYKVTQAKVTNLDAMPSLSSIVLGWLRLSKPILWISFSLMARVTLFVGLAWVLVKWFERKNSVEHETFGPALWMSLFLTAAGIAVFQAVPTNENTYQFPYIGYVACWYALIPMISRLTLNSKRSMAATVIGTCFIAVITSTHSMWGFDVDWSQSLGHVYAARHSIEPETARIVTDLAREGRRIRIGYVLTQREVETYDVKWFQPLIYVPGNKLGYLAAGMDIEPISPFKYFATKGTKETREYLLYIYRLLPLYGDKRPNLETYDHYFRLRPMDRVMYDGQLYEPHEFLKLGILDEQIRSSGSVGP